MTPEEAEAIFYAFGDCLDRQLLLHPEKQDATLRSVSRDELRKAILIWVAKERYEGVDILYRQKLPDGQSKAPLEIADAIWAFTALYGPVRNGIPVMESREEGHQAAVFHDEFVKFILELPPNDTDYWIKVETQLDR